MASEYQQLLDEWESEMDPYLEEFCNSLQNHTNYIRNFINNKIISDVKPTLNRILEKIPSNNPDKDSINLIIADLLGKLDDYSNAWSIKEENGKFGICLEDEFKDTFTSLEYGTPYTPTFRHLQEIEKLVQEISTEVNKSISDKFINIVIKRKS